MRKRNALEGECVSTLGGNRKRWRRGGILQGVKKVVRWRYPTGILDEEMNFNSHDYSYGITFLNKLLLKIKVFANAR